jgi:hypothetical protein
LPQHRRISIKRTNRPPSASKPGMDENERVAIRDEGYDLDDPKVIAALERVRAELGDRTDLIHPFERRGPAGLRSPGFSRAAIRHRPLFWWSCRESNPSVLGEFSQFSDSFGQSGVLESARNDLGKH